MAGSPRAAPLLRIVDLSVAYGPETALHGFSLACCAGLTEVVGPNGAGKTTLVRAVAGLLGRHGGRVVGGQIDVGTARVAGVLAGGRVFAGLTVAENLQAGAIRLKRRAAAARQGWVLERFPMFAARLGDRAGHLSGGERQLLAVARALMASPGVLVLDEPTIGLAPAAVALVGSVLDEAAAAGAAVLMTALAEGSLPIAGAAVVALDRGRPVQPAAAQAS